MNPNNYHDNRGSMQGYPSGYTHYGQGNRLPSSTTSSQLPPYESQESQPPPYEAQVGSRDIPNQYGYSPDDWQNSFILPHPTLPESVTAGNVNVQEIHGLARSANEDPFSGLAPAPGPRLHTNPQFWHPNTNAPKAYTVAAQPIAEPLQRPLFKPRPSFTSLADSGFVSGPPLSEDLPNSGDPSSQSIFQFPSDPQAIPAVPESVKSDPHPQGSQEVAKRRRSKAPVPPCSSCGKELKNASDASKHELQHTKPFHCRQPGCQRKDGFATKNDLERHRKSVHHVNPLVGKKSGYICRACPAPSPGAGPKWWPRLDNFKAHIQRKHKDWDMQKLIESSESFKPEDALSDPGYGSQPAHSHSVEDQGYQQDFSSPIGHGMDRHPSHQGDFASIFAFDQNRQDQLAGVGAVTDQFAGRRESGNRFHGSRLSVGSGHGMAVLYDAASQQLTSPVDSMIQSPMGARLSVPNALMNNYGNYDLHSQRPSQMQSDDRAPKRQRLSGPMDSQQSFVARHAEGDHTCRECGKTKKRECDLRKHMKRHTRPYGCTFPNCVKRFGSRNDWKRHENSQHFLQEMWRCEHKRQDGSKCGKLVYHEDTFAQHLHRKHGIALKSSQGNADCKSMHLGREGHHHFWCGFCNKLVEQRDSMHQGAWDMRFKHIGDHFDKDNYHIDNWIDIEQNKRKKFITQEDRKKSKGRLRSGRFDDDDDSDLGEAGIPEPYISGFTAPLSQAAAGYGTRLFAQTGVLQRKRKRTDTGDVDADAVSDEEFHM